jgi:hypothetical protein
MKARALITSRRYFGLEALDFSHGAERVLARVDPPAQPAAGVNALTLGEDFRLEPEDALALVKALIDKGLLEAEPARAGDFRLTERFREFARARVVPPLHRAEARELIDEVCQLAARMNSAVTRSPLSIDRIAVSGNYMSRSDKISEITLWVVVKRRGAVRRRRSEAPLAQSDAAKEIRSVMRALSPFIVVHVVSEAATIERPFSVPFRADVNFAASPPPAARLLTWGTSIRRQLGRR